MEFSGIDFCMIALGRNNLVKISFVEETKIKEIAVSHVTMIVTLPFSFATCFFPVNTLKSSERSIIQISFQKLFHSSINII